MTGRIVSPDNGSKSEISVSRENWMSELKGDMRLNDIWLPGTHDSATGHGVRFTKGPIYGGFAGTVPAIFGLDLTKSQNLSIEEQLKYGIRFIDLRVSASGKDEIIVVHNFVALDVGIADVASAITNFLSTHPKEVVILALKNDGDGSDDKVIDATIQKYFSHEIFQKIDYIPYISEIRGKVLVMSRTTCDPERQRSLGYPIKVPDNTKGELTTPDGANRPTAFIQDLYQPAGKDWLTTTKETHNAISKSINPFESYNPFKSINPLNSDEIKKQKEILNGYIETKKAVIKAAFENAEAENPDVFRIGFASATQSPVTPLHFADQINPTIAGMLNDAKDRAWIVPLDFAGNQDPDEDPVIAIIKKNFKSVPKRHSRSKMFPGDRFGRDVYLHSPSERYRAGLDSHGIFWIFDVGVAPGEKFTKIGPQTDGIPQTPADFIEFDGETLKAFIFPRLGESSGPKEIAATNYNKSNPVNKSPEQNKSDNKILELTDEGNLVIKCAGENQNLWESRSGKFVSK